MLAITHLPVVPLAAIVMVLSLLRVLGSGYFTGATALITSTAHPSYRGQLMGRERVGEQVGMAGAWLIAGMVVSTAAGGWLSDFGTVGWIAVGVTLLAVVLMSRLAAVSAQRRRRPSTT